MHINKCFNGFDVLFWAEFSHLYQILFLKYRTGIIDTHSTYMYEKGKHRCFIYALYKTQNYDTNTSWCNWKRKWYSEKLYITNKHLLIKMNENVRNLYAFKILHNLKKMLVLNILLWNQLLLQFLFKCQECIFVCHNLTIFS